MTVNSTMSSIRASSAALMACALAGAFMARPAAAQPASKDGGQLAPKEAAQPTSKDAAMAETLFEDAKKRMTSGDYAGACPKLAESYRLDPGSGTLTALALCHEQLGQTASAWAEFIEVVTDAQQAGRPDRERFARQHVSALEAQLSRLTISVAPETAQLPEVQVRRDKVVVGPAAWGVASPIDPGDHLIEASAPGKLTWTVHVTIGPHSDAQSVAVPALQDAPEQAGGEPQTATPAAAANETSQASETSPTPSGGGTQRAVGWLLGSVGLASLVTGSVFGVEAMSKSSDAKAQCPGNVCTTSHAISENGDAKTDALIADVTLGAGVVAAGIGLYLVLSAPSGESSAPSNTSPGVSGEPAGTSRLQLVPSIGRHSGGMTLQAIW
jgi:hypothetical protein